LPRLFAVRTLHRIVAVLRWDAPCPNILRRRKAMPQRIVCQEKKPGRVYWAGLFWRTLPRRSRSRGGANAPNGLHPD
jgi:hypothetical protein